MSLAAEMMEICPGFDQFVLQNGKGVKYVHAKFPGGEHGEDDVMTPPDNVEYENIGKLGNIL